MSSDRALIKAKDKEIEILKRRLEGLQKDGGAVSDVFSSTNEVQDVSDIEDFDISWLWIVGAEVSSLRIPSPPWKPGSIA